MADSNIGLYENSQQDGQPIECYKFSVGGNTYLYTSSREDINLIYNENGTQRTETYAAEYIKRETIKPGSKGDSGSTEVTISKDFVIAKMFQGPPPEQKVKLSVIRLHGQDNTKFDTVLTGRVSQGNFEDSECKLTVKMESYMAKQIPNGTRQFTCGNVIYDSKCRLKEDNLKVAAHIGRVDGLSVYSSSFANYEDGYFANGLFRWSGYVRQITDHKGEQIVLKYPLNEIPYGDCMAAPGCDMLFETCHKRFGNTLNYTGCPYVPPANPEHTAVGKGVYWVDSKVIQRDSDGFIGTISM